ncbi:MAG: dual specificity phosphatase 12 [Marteilia pararefringens]
MLEHDTIRCYNCQISLFQADNIYHRCDKSMKDYYYVEPVFWMKERIKGLQKGKILCRGCNIKVGNFTWGSQQCKFCEEWICPAFRIHLKTMCKPNTNAPIKIYRPVEESSK